jgi:hypothetical protein
VGEVHQRAVSSAKPEQFVGMSTNSSDVKIMNRRALRLEPWGVPEAKVT